MEPFGGIGEEKNDIRATNFIIWSLNITGFLKCGLNRPTLVFCLKIDVYYNYLRRIKMKDLTKAVNTILRALEEAEKGGKLNVNAITEGTRELKNARNADILRNRKELADTIDVENAILQQGLKNLDQEYLNRLKKLDNAKRKLRSK